MLAEKARAAAVSQATVYIEDVFSTYLYTGTGSSQTITNNIDLSGNGGLTWIKSRSAATGHRLTDTVRGVTKSLASETTAAEATESTGLTAFSTTGFTIGADGDYNTNTSTYASWTFREQAKFFDIVTYTGTGANRTVAHNLGSAPGCIIVKCTSVGGAGYDWRVYHRSLTSAAYTVQLNTTSAESSQPSIWNSTAPTSTVFTVGTDISVNETGQTYVAYIYAHDAGGFGLSGTDNVISCGSYVGNLTGQSINVGFEPQFLLFKYASIASDWLMFDTMRGMTVTTSNPLRPNTSGQESTGWTAPQPTATGFKLIDNTLNDNGDTILYIAIRRPMKVPESGTEVYNAIARTGTGAAATVTGVGFAPDLYLSKGRSNTIDPTWYDKLRGNGNELHSNNTNAELYRSDEQKTFTQDGVTLGGGGWQYVNWSGWTYINWFFRRAPGFFDEVCYTGTGANTTQTHNLTVAPELWIVKRRNGAAAWTIGCTAIANTEYLVFSTTAAKATDATAWNSTYPSATVVSLGTQATVNTSTATYVAYLFATLAGVSKVGSYTGTATTLQVNCGFTAGARFVIIKRTDSTGDWYVWDSTRGIVAGNDPYLLFNSTAAEVTGTDYVDTYSAGFEISSTAPAAINASGGTFIFLAIA